MSEFIIAAGKSISVQSKLFPLGLYNNHDLQVFIHLKKCLSLIPQLNCKRHLQPLPPPQITPSNLPPPFKEVNLTQKTYQRKLVYSTNLTFHVVTGPSQLVVHVLVSFTVHIKQFGVYVNHHRQA